MNEDPNRNNKDRLFKYIFGREEHKDWTLSLYNAVNGSSYTNPDDIVINTIDDVMYLGMKNDVSFIISETMNIYEQQSSFNPNMPIRQFIYAGQLYGKHIEKHSVNIYGSSLKKLPAPKLICFYNGENDRPEREVLKLSDAFVGQSDINVEVSMININFGKNKELLTGCKVLGEYSWIVQEIRKNRKEMGLDMAIENAIKRMDKDALLKPFLTGHLAEVKYMCLREYTENEIKEMFKKDGVEEGIEIGEYSGMLKTLFKLVEKKIITVKQAAEQAEMTEDEFNNLMTENGIRDK